jgi:hypothetical protein
MCLNGNTVYFKDIISRGADVSGIMIHKACLGGHKDVVQLFLESGADANFFNDVGYLPLYIASKLGNLEICNGVSLFLLSTLTSAPRSRSN